VDNHGINQTIGCREGGLRGCKENMRPARRC
jgi:hypothetical protein